MKNATQIITSLQYKPQYHKLLEQKCVNRLKSSFLLSIQNYIKYGYIRGNKLTFVVGATLNKHDIAKTIEIVKTILNSPMLLESDKFCECLDIQIDDVEFKVDHKPKKTYNLYSTKSDKSTYKERATGDIEVDIKDEKLKKLAKSILDIIKAKHDS
jgi:hypothetical protein